MVDGKITNGKDSGRISMRPVMRIPVIGTEITSLDMVFISRPIMLRVTPVSGAKIHETAVVV
jgi:hypothetical protein